MNPSLRALNRFGLGARPGEATRLSDPRGWLEDQLERGGAPLRPAPDGRGDPRALLADQREVARSGDPDAQAELRRRIRDHTGVEAGGALAARIATDRPFVERLVAFWSNHLCVAAGAKLPTGLLAGAYEREAIRPHVLGRFEEMVLASARHPAMLTYLDNAQSVGPDSPGARGVARRRGDDAPRLGLNENYARELLELHTLGVDGGYTQDDVRELARILTGWTVRGLGAATRLGGGGELGFLFAAPLHDPGEKTVLGRRYGGGEEEGRAVIRDLCRHPATASFVARKLVGHFVADAAPADAVDVVARSFRDTDGDLAAVARTLVHLDAAWEPERVKFRMPQDWLVALLRGVGAEDAPPALLGVLRQLRQPLWSPPSPRGYGDTVADWADPDSLMNRAELARTVARTVAGSLRRGGEAGAGGRAVGRAMAGRVEARVQALADLVEHDPGDPLPGLLADSSIPVDERVALAFAGPAFQWR